MRHLSLLLVAVTALACDPTDGQTVLVIDTTFGVPCSADAVEVTIRESGEARETPRAQLRPDDLPLSLTLVPGEQNRDVEIEVRLFANDALIARATGVTEVRATEARLVRALLEPSCTDAMPCPLDEAVPFDGDVPPPVERASCTATLDGGVGDACVPTFETCNGLDDDCDTEVDEDFDLTSDPQHCSACNSPCGGGELCEASQCIEVPVRRYTMETTTLEAFQSACSIPGRERFLASADEAEVALPEAFAMPFAFDFYGEPVSALYVGDGGYVGIDAAPGRESITVAAIASATAPRPALVPFWERLQLRSSGVCAAVTGVAPDRRLHISWDDACIERGSTCDDDDHLSFSVILEERTDRIRFVYGPMISNLTPERARGSEAAIGITSEGSAGCDACNAEGLCPDETPCGLTAQPFATEFPAGVPNLLFTPVAEP